MKDRYIGKNITIDIMTDNLIKDMMIQFANCNMSYSSIVRECLELGLPKMISRLEDIQKIKEEIR